MSWLPSICIQGWCMAEREGTYEGWVLSFKWRGFVFEIAVARLDP